MGHKLNIKCVDSRVNVNIVASTSVPFTLTTVQVPNLALTLTRRITVRKHRGGMGALEKCSFMPCAIYVMTVGWVHMPYTAWLSKDVIYLLVEYK